MIALENYDFLFNDDEVTEFKRMWAEGIHVGDIADRMHRAEIEIGILVVDQHDKGNIQLRIGGALGGDAVPREYGYGRFTHADLGRMKQMIDRGAKNADIATSFAISTHYVNRIKRDMGWTRGYGKRGESA